MKKIIKLTESNLVKIIQQIINESSYQNQEIEIFLRHFQERLKLYLEKNGFTVATSSDRTEETIPDEKNIIFKIKNQPLGIMDKMFLLFYNKNDYTELIDLLRKFNYDESGELRIEAFLGHNNFIGFNVRPLNWKENHEREIKRLESQSPQDTYNYLVSRDKGVGYPKIRVDEFKILPKEYQYKYVMKIAENRHGVDSHITRLLTPEQQFEYILKRMSLKFRITEDQFETLKPKDRIKYVMILVDRPYGISDEQFSSLDNNTKIKYVSKRIANNQKISYNQYMSLTPEQRRNFKESGGQTYKSKF